MKKFDGMTQVYASKASEASYNIICFIERYRNNEFYERIEYLMKPFGWFEALLYDDLSFVRWVFGKKARTEEEAKEIARVECSNWPTYSFEYNQANLIITLAHCSDNQMVYLNPEQAKIVMIGNKMKRLNITGKERLDNFI